MDARLMELLNILSDDSYYTASQIARRMNLSEKTIRNTISKLNIILEDNGAIVFSKPGVGFHLQVDDIDGFKKWFNGLSLKTDSLPSTPSERFEFIILYLLKSRDYVKIEGLCDLLFVSRNTITSDMKQIEYIIGEYDLKIERRPNYGMRIVGEEIKKRLCIANFTLNSNKRFALLSDSEELEITKILSAVIKNNNLSISENVFENLVIHLLVANERIRENSIVSYSIDAEQELLTVVGESMIRISEQIAKGIFNSLAVHYNRNEILYVAIHLSGKIHFDDNVYQTVNIVISKRIDKIITTMLERIYLEMKIDFRTNLDLRMSLNQHMVPLDIRLRYEISMKNPLLSEIKSEHSFAFAVASSACSYINERYETVLSEDEVAYFAMIFALGIEKMKSVSQKYNIVMVCASGRGTSQLFSYKYKKSYGDYINNMYETTIFDLYDFDFEGKNIDFVFTTIPIGKSLSIPIYEVSLFPDHEEVNTVRNILRFGNNNLQNELFSQDLFLTDVKGETYESVLRNITETVKSKLSLPENFLDLVMRRESMAATDLGNLVAIPHPYEPIDHRSFVVCAILEKPIKWGYRNVQVVLLISLDKNEKRDAVQFYRTITNYMSNSIFVEDTIKYPTFENFKLQLDCASKL